MEKQRSFSIKPTRLWLFSFTISFSVIFLIFFSIWVLNLPLSTPQDPHLHFNTTTSVPLDLKPNFKIQTLSSFHTNYSATQIKNSILVGTHFSRIENESQISNISASEGILEKESEPKSVAYDINSNSTVLFGVKNSTFSGNRSTKSETVSEVLQIDSANRSTKQQQQQNVSFPLFKKIEGEASSDIVLKVVNNKKVCDITKGKWVFDESYPLYTNASCPYIDEGFSCESNGRLDKHYMKWRWQPQDCDIPGFNATQMLELIRGKRLVFVGDSINRNQWESMMCLLMGAIADPRKVYETRGRRITKEKGNYCFKFVDYQCTVEYYVTHFLVHEGKARIGSKRVQTLRIDTVDKSSSRWRGADILVFNTAHWWSHHKTKAGKNYYQERNQVHPRLDVSTAFEKALTTWAQWVDRHVNPSKTQVFFRSSAPSHFSGGQWNTGGHCRETSQPLPETYKGEYPEKNMIVEQIIGKMKTPVTFLNITGMSEYRIDGHPSIYGRKPGSSSRVQDCSHWCLPGVPDTWNEILYMHLESKRRKSLTN
ncbi:protein trichome birefringence-like 6 [Nicotiana tabacum]|uniref:Protein trichome birefringence-like 6 n=1 Tax=Nicotiana tabacum TaxID=4097 RepID=A0A1S3XX78_TOBAC|nr:protein trichome birefringence-like 6 [Nicotiana tomentosiformis]XP_016444546.1 PREDICTED: protein trichome birefringence-like 6 [Nicotiana tabacum]